MTTSIHVEPFFYELQPRLKTRIINDDTGEIIAQQIITSVQSTHTLNASITAYLHAHGFQRTGKFTRVRDGWAHAHLSWVGLEARDTNTIKDSEVERMGVL